MQVQEANTLERVYVWIYMFWPCMHLHMYVQAKNRYRPLGPRRRDVVVYMYMRTYTSYASTYDEDSSKATYKSSSTTSTTPRDQAHGVPRRRCRGSPRRFKRHQPCKCDYDDTTQSSTPTRRTTQAGMADIPVMLYRLMDRRGPHANATYIYTNTTHRQVKRRSTMTTNIA
jgi:hypothetical protein